MRAKHVYENIEFERGLEPHEAMGIGIKGAKFFQRLHSIAMDQVGEKFHTVSDIYWNRNGQSIFTIHSMRKIDHDYAPNPDGNEEEYTIYLTKTGDVIAYYDDNGVDLYIGNEELFKKFIRIDDTIDESIEFERGVEPREAMGIGNEHEYLISRLDKIAKIHKMKKEVINANRYRDSWSMKNGGYISLIKSKTQPFDSNTKHPSYYIEYDTGVSYGNTTVEDWLDDTSVYWKKLSLRESIEFERGQEPKDAMNIGRSRKVKKGDEFNMRILYPNKKSHVVRVKATRNEFTIKGKRRVEVYIDIFPSESKEWWVGFDETIKEWQLKLLSFDYEDLHLKESIEFERGLEPKAAMNMGRGRKIKKGDEFNVKLISWVGPPFKTRIVKATALQDEYLYKYSNQHFDERRVQVSLFIPLAGQKEWWVNFNEEEKEWQKNCW